MNAPPNQTNPLRLLLFVPYVVIRALLLTYLQLLRIPLSVHSPNAHLAPQFPFNAVDIHDTLRWDSHGQSQRRIEVDVTLRRVGTNTTSTSWLLEVDQFPFARFTIPVHIMNDPTLPFNVDADLVLMALQASLVEDDAVALTSSSFADSTGNVYTRFRLVRVRDGRFVTAFERSRLQRRGSAHGFDLVFDDSLDAPSV